LFQLWQRRTQVSDISETSETWCYSQNQQTETRFWFYRCYKQRVKKRELLKKVFILELYILDIYKIDLSNLIKSSSFTVLYTLAKNRIEIDLDIFVDTRVNRFVFINITFTDQFCKSLSLQLTALFCTI
jgi:hypothetical protein